MTMIRRRLQWARYLALRRLGELVEKPVTKRRLRTVLYKHGFRGVELSDVGGSSDLYTWAGIGIDGQPRFVVKAPPAFGIRPKWRHRKPSRLFEQMNVIERVEFINRQSSAFSEAGYGPRRISVGGERIAVIEWAPGTSLGATYPKFDLFQTVIGAVVELSQQGLHHGDLHAGNVLLGSDESVSFIDSDNKFSGKIDGNTALLVDIATLTGSVISGVPKIDVDNTKGICAEAIRDLAGDSLLSEVGRIAREYRSENWWLTSAAENLTA